MKKLLGFACLVAVVVTTSLSGASTATRTKPTAVPADAVLTWNTNAVDAVRGSSPAKSQIDAVFLMAYAQAAVYGAVTKLEGRYVPYHDVATAVAPDGSVQAAVAAAASTILDHYLPDQQPTVDAEYAAYLATLTGNVAGGVAVGEAAANDLIALRTGDGRNAATPVYGTIGPVLPGQWQLQTPAQTAAAPWAATMRPFMLERPSQFRADPPPALDSEQYAKDFDEVKAYGSVDSSARTPEQTAIAYFWNAFSINQSNGTMQNVVRQHDLDIVDAARLFAMGDLVMSDAGLACFDSKYFYLSWRPITAIANADKDGNDDTTADAAWTPLLATPNHPEYPSAHGCLDSALIDAVAVALGSDHVDVAVPGATNGGTTLTTTRHFEAAHDYQAELVDARVWIGFHFRNSTVQGERLGNAVAAWTLDRYFQPVR
jgi:hypothetical protein